MSAAPVTMTIAFGDYELNERLFQLRRAGTLVPMPPKAFDLLAYLLRHRDRVVTKAELFARVWPAEVVTGSSLTSCINTVRGCLGDDGDAQRFIETVRGRGYRFTGPVLQPPDQDVTAATPRAPAATSHRATFVGRSAELTRMAGVLARVLGGRGQAMLVTGDAGIGKTRLVEEFGAHARTAGATVVVGAAREGEGIPAFWPWVESLRSLADAYDGGELRALLGPGAAELAELVPSIGARFPGLPPTQAPAAQHARVRLFDSVARFLAAAAARRPVVLVLDDLHLADQSTLLLLEFLGRDIARTRLLVLGIYRDVQLEAEHPLVTAACTLRRDADCERLHLRGLEPADVRDLMQARTSAHLPEAVVAAVARVTEGNPLFVIEMHEHLAEEGAIERLGATLRTDLDLTALGVPEGVRHVIGRRLSRLRKGSLETLQLAAVLGREFSFDVLSRVSGLRRAILVERLDEAIAAGVLLVRPLPLRRYAFEHALIRETLYQGLPALARMQRHLQVGLSLARLHATNGDAHAAELAHHFLEAAPLGGVSRAVEHATRAGHRAAAALAYEDAVSHYERALAALATLRRPSRVQRARLLVALAEAQSRSARTAAAQEAFREAAALARAAGDLDVLVQAALGLGGRHLRLFGAVDREAVAVLEETLGAVAAGPPRLRAALLGRLTLTLRHDPESLTRRCALATEAVALARRTEEPALLASVLDDVLWGLWRPANLDERLATAAELGRLSHQAGDQELELRAHGWRIVTLLERGDLAGVDAAMEAHARLAESVRLLPYRWDVLNYRAMRALMAGRFAEAERFAEEAYAGRDYRPPHNADLVYGTQAGIARVMQGRGEDVLAMIERLLDRHPTAWRAALAWIEVQVGRLDEARHHLEALVGGDRAELPADSVWLVSHAFLAVVSHELGDARRAARLHERLAPYHGRLIVVSEYGLACLGAVRHYTGLLAATMGRWDEAFAHFEHARAVHTELGGPPLQVLTDVAHARSLLARGRAADRPRARRLLDGAAATAERLGMQQVEAQARATLRAVSRRARAS